MLFTLNVKYLQNITLMSKQILIGYDHIFKSRWCCNFWGGINKNQEFKWLLNDVILKFAYMIIKQKCISFLCKNYSQISKDNMNNSYATSYAPFSRSCPRFALRDFVVFIFLPTKYTFITCFTMDLLEYSFSFFVNSL